MHRRESESVGMRTSSSKNGGATGRLEGSQPVDSGSLVFTGNTLFINAISVIREASESVGKVEKESIM